MSANVWRDPAGFGRAVEVSPGVWSTVGPDDEDHASGCEFIRTLGLLPCSCDATRARIPGRGMSRSWWYRCWFRWQECRVSPWETRNRVPWPVKGPDGDPWVEGVDYQDAPEVTG